MKLKSLLLATLLFAALAVSASAQQKAVERRQSDSFQGPVKSVRIEQATFRRVGGEPVETPRRLISFVNYAPDGKSREVVDYAPDGSVQYRYTYFYDDEGRDVETSQFDASDHLLRRSVYIPQAGEELVYNGDGSLRERSVLVWGYDGRRVGTMVYDGAGALKERHVGTREGGLSVWSVYRPDGTLKRRDTNTPNNGGPRRTVLQTYGADGSLVRRKVLDWDAATTEQRVVVEVGGDAAEVPTRATREFDSHKNLIKQTRYAWNKATGEYEPSEVTYYTITYYR